MPSETPAPYDQVAANYDRTRGWSPVVAARIGAVLVGALAGAAPPDRPLRVIEPGAGTGRVLLPLAAAGAWVLGADLSAGMLSTLRAKAQDGAGGAGAVRAVRADAARLPFAAGTFDAAVLVHILHLVPDWQRVLAEVIRVVRPGGPIALGIDESAPSAADWIAERWAAQVAAAGGARPPNRRAAVHAAALQALAARGYRLHEPPDVTWAETQTPAEALARYRDRCYGASWDLPDGVLRAGLAGLEADLRARFGHLDTPLAQTRRFRLQVGVPGHLA